MADKYANQSGLTYLISKIRAYVDAKVIAPLASKTYSGIYASANTFASATFYFASIRPTSWYKVWRIKYRIQVTAGSDNNYAGSAIVEIYGCQANRLTYAIFNNHYNTSYRSFYYHDLYSLTAAGYTNGFGHTLGIELTNSANPTSATYARNFTVEILETDNCDVTLFNSMLLYASIPGTGATNFTGYGQYDGQNNGLRESGDDNNYNVMMVDTRLYAGAKGIYGQQILLQLPDGKWESLTSVYSTATNKTKNTSGFLLPGMFHYPTSTTVASGGLTATWNNYNAINNTTFQYSSNCGTTLVPYKSIYLVGTIVNGLFYLDDVWWTQTLPTTEDGKVYVYVGEAITTSSYSLHLQHPIFKYVNGHVKEVSIAEAEYNTVEALNNGNAYFDNYNELGVLDTSNIYVHWTTES